MDFGCGLCKGICYIRQVVWFFAAPSVEMPYRRKQKRVTLRNRNRKRGGSLGRIPASATVSIQQDPYSARMLVDTDTAEDMFDARGAYLL